MSAGPPGARRSRRVIYTALFGGYERLNDDQAIQPGVDLVCFTDDEQLRSDVWNVVRVQRDLEHDSHRSQRCLKLTGHSIIRGYDESLYIDNSISLLDDVSPLFDDWLSAHDIGFARHSFRASVAEEFAIVLGDSLDDHARIAEQWDHYLHTSPEALAGPAVWGGVIARRWTDQVTAACETWYHHVLRYSRRDQLSVMAALQHHGLTPHLAEVDNHTSDWHRWPVALDRNSEMRSANAVIRTPEGILATRERIELDRAVTALSDHISVLSGRLADAEAASVAATPFWRLLAEARSRVLRRLSRPR